MLSNVYQPIPAFKFAMPFFFVQEKKIFHFTLDPFLPILFFAMKKYLEHG